MGCKLTKVLPQGEETPKDKLGGNIVPRVTPPVTPINGNAAEQPKGDVYLHPPGTGAPRELDRGPLRRKYPMMVIPVRKVLER